MDENNRLIRLTKMTNIAIEQEVYEQFSQSFSSILKLCATLDSVDTKGVNTMFSVFDIEDQGLQNQREDIVDDGGYQDKVLANCPDKEDIFIGVPKIIE
ncbi:Asp-tRNA(Asn)/Glu-tRNA(Gln) amidotransferase subunit GatC [Candidatus Hepatincolaceae symbiont of Richtersius coronifer]